MLTVQTCENTGLNAETGMVLHSVHTLLVQLWGSRSASSQIGALVPACLAEAGATFRCVSNSVLDTLLVAATFA